MVHTNKILTVSYGTFSCTLEGFDDSFQTMKAIAEYFRDLAADDRYFGAEPPQPDAEMLARIAQREISRRVEAHTEGSAIVLRAGTAAATAALDAAPQDIAPQNPVTEAVTQPPTPDTAPESEAPAADAAAAVPVETAQPAEVQDDEQLPEAAAETQPEGVAETVAQASQEPVEQTTDKSETDAHADAVEHMSDDAAAVGHQVHLTQTAAPSGDSIAAKLQRIREVVARGNTGMVDDVDPDMDESLLVAVTDTVFEQEEMTEVSSVEIAEIAEETAEEIAVQAVGAPIEDTAEEPADAVAGQIADAVEDHPEAADEDDMIAAIAGLSDEPVAHDAEYALADEEADAGYDLDADIAALTKRNEEAGDTVATDLPDAAGDLDIAQDAAADAEGTDADEDDRPFNLAAFEAVTAAATSYDDEYEDEAVGDLDLGDEDQGEDTIFAGLDTPDEALDAGGAAYDDDADDMDNILAEASDDNAPAGPHRARVVKVRRADLEAAIQRGALEQVDDDEDSALTPEDEADLLRELAEVEAELDVPAETDEKSQMDEETGTPTGQTGQPTVEPDADMPRLLVETGNKMAEKESRANREAYAQLRAAVAAAKAEAQIVGGPALLTEDKEYRDDLASVVRADRPMTRPSTRPSTRPVSKLLGENAVPLKLVAEQRVDGDATKPDHPQTVRPRRVTTELLDIEPGLDDSDEPSEFAIFAEKVGAQGLSQLLEAAAAYMSYVEGRDQFSRPQLMTKVRQVEKEEFNREDGLRSFGQLLRDGKIEKTGGGRFTASPDIGFRPDHRAAG